MVNSVALGSDRFAYRASQPYYSKLIVENMKSFFYDQE